MTTKTKPRLSFWQIWNMCFGFFGIQIGWGLQNANVSRIFQSLGASIDEIPILWIAAPLTGLLVQPIVGYFSDHTWNRFGRRHPGFHGIVRHAQFFVPVDGCGHALDHGRLDQHHHGAIPRLCRRHAAG